MLNANESKPSREKLLQFMKDWRKRLIERRRNSADLSEEEFGQLVTLNTLIYYVETEI